MTPQSHFFVLASIAAGREAQLQELLASMIDLPGRARGDNPLIPFASFDTLHFARLVVVDDQTLDDTLAHGGPRPTPRPGLAFAGEVDGDLETFFDQLARQAGPGLGTLFGCCESFSAADDLGQWLRQHHVPAAASYVNWVGRTVVQVKENAALFAAVQDLLAREWPTLSLLPPHDVHRRLRSLIWEAVGAGRLTLTPEARTPLGWRLRSIAHRVGWPLLLLLLSPLWVPLAVIGLLILRRREQTDPELCPRTPPAHVAALAAVEDFDVTNAFTAMGSLKPGRVRRWATVALLGAIDFAARHVFTTGRLARVRSIHFARWVFLDDKSRVIFLSNYDGSLESYMDDFINKVGFGLNLSFCHGIGYPRTHWLIGGGSSDERKFKEYLRRHQLPTQVWFRAYPGMTAVDLERHARVRHGLEAAQLGGREARAWVELL